MSGRAWRDEDFERARQLLCSLGDGIRDALVVARTLRPPASFAIVSHVSTADTIYEIDRVSEQAIELWFTSHWPEHWPVEVVMEGLDAGEPCTFPRGTAREETVLKCIIDPIDGTRGLMYDKRSAWTLAALAPQLGEQTRLADLRVAAMTELPTTKQWRADQISAVRGGGLVAESVNVLDSSRTPLALRPSTATDFRHGFASVSKFFPEGKAATATIEEELWRQLYGVPAPLIFDDQYISSGGQIYELLIGHDRMVCDFRPLVNAALGFESALVCHPYDVCTSLLLTEAGAVFEAPCGGPVEVALDLLSPVSWAGYANAALADQVRPLLAVLLANFAEQPPGIVTAK